ncbi:RidA family protein [Candidatus Xianfuyuplasma coldseepsis]|uniref:RidA family protein n=1 Tax=Candidatus Xianfuyuplasma coldseepsis TaxID=2782163 RepID=A0A7L7KRL3_9MOLU|nr:RidA family protein [Xianfuyuplasma coldseepsis]QMS85461.1 RidA family protein [Xianfuyuplasma coldseepsis]
MKIIETKHAPKAVGPYSQGIVANDTLYVSGQIPYVPETMTPAGDDIQSQTRQSLMNVLAIVKEAGFQKENIVKCGVFLKDLSMFGDMNAIYAEIFGDHKPARFAVEVARLPLDVLVEIDAIAVKE